MNDKSNRKTGLTKVIYIVGDGRCGSTILDRFLGVASGGVSLNELNELLRFGYEERRRCACGEVFPDCEFWEAITKRLSLTEEKRARLSAAQRKYESTKRFFATSKQLEKQTVSSDLAEYVNHLSELIGAISATQNKHIILDSSKLPARALLLNRCSNAEVYVVHVVRHPCAVVNAWRKTKFDPGRGDKMENHGLIRTVAFWWARNMVGGMLKRKLPYRMVRYEDFVTNPIRVADSVMQMLDEPLMSIDQAEEGFALPPLHTISGNPDRFSSGRTKLRLDEKWKIELPKPQRALVNLLTAPALKKFGYTN